MSKAKAAKPVKLKAWEKVYQVLMTGSPTTKEEIDALLGKEILMYRLSTFIWAIKAKGGGIVKVVKDGRKVGAYQLVNPEAAKEYLKNRGVVLDTNPVKKMKDLQATPAKETEVLTVTEVTEPTVTA